MHLEVQELSKNLAGDSRGHRGMEEEESKLSPRHQSRHEKYERTRVATGLAVSHVLHEDRRCHTVESA